MRLVARRFAARLGLLLTVAFAGAAPAHSQHPAEDTRIDEIGLLCSNGDSTVQFVELVATRRQEFSDQVRLRVTDRFGNVRFDESSLFDPLANGTTWPNDSRWLIATAGLQTSLGIAPDKTIPPVLDLYGGRIALLVPGPQGDVTLHEVVYGAAGGPNAPRAGSSLQRQHDDSMSPDTSPDPTNFSDAAAEHLDCTCPASSVTGADGVSHVSTEPAAGASGCSDHPPACGSASYDLITGEISSSVSGQDMLGGGGARVVASDVYFVVGPVAGTPVAVVVELVLDLAAHAARVGSSGGSSRATGSIRHGATVVSHSLYGNDPPVEEHVVIRLNLQVAAHEPFLLTFGGETSATAGSARVVGLFSFVLPGSAPTTTIVSCQGYVPPFPTSIQIALEDVDVSEHGVRLRWYESGEAEGTAQVQRAGASESWASIGAATREGSRWTFEDTGVVAGASYGYRLARRDRTGEVLSGESWVTIPAGAELTLAPPSPHPCAERARLGFTLRGGAPARLDVVDVAGRQVMRRDLGALGSGRHTLDLFEERRLPPGLYLARLTEGAASRTTRFLVVP